MLEWEKLQESSNFQHNDKTPKSRIYDFSVSFSMFYTNIINSMNYFHNQYPQSYPIYPQVN